MAQYQVDSYHLAVGAGDAAIHLLVDSTTAGPACLGTVLKAVLIDGGKPNRGAGLIAQCIQHINTRYVFNAGATHLQFDAIVITHWDEDHWGGISELLSATIAYNVANTPTTPYPGYLKYSVTGAPLTRMYTPEYGYSDVNSKILMAVGVPTMAVLYAPGFMLPNVCRAFMEPTAPPGYAASILGADFFTDARCGMDPLNCNNPTELVTTYNPLTGDLPAMYCLAVEKRCIGGNTAHVTGAVDIVDKDGVTDTNKASIANMIIWPIRGGPGATGKPHLSHYFAGDLWYQEERKNVQWTQCTDAFNQTPGNWVTNLKLSHHGANQSTPKETLQRWRPYNILASSGSQYFHPSWELVIFLAVWFNNMPITGRTAVWRPLHCTQYPYYLVKTPNGNYNNDTNMSTTAFTGRGAPQRQYRLALQLEYNKMLTGYAGRSALFGPGIETPYQTFTRLVGLGFTANQVLKWLIGERSWDFISPTPKTRHPAITGPVGTPAVWVTVGTMVQWVKIISRDQGTGHVLGLVQRPPGGGANRELEADTKDLQSLTEVYNKVQGRFSEIKQLPLFLAKTRPLQAGYTINSDKVGNPSPVFTSYDPKLQAADATYQDPRYLMSTKVPVVKDNGSYSDRNTGTDPNEADFPSDDEGDDANAAADDEAELAAPDGGDPPPNPTGTFYFITTSAVQMASSATVQSLGPSNLNAFLAMLQFQGLLLGDSPKANETVPFHSQDALQSWFSFFLSTDVKLNAKFDENSNINGFTLAFGDYSFSTELVPTSLGLNNLKPGEWDTIGLIPWKGILVLGLESVSPSVQDKFGLGDILKPFTDNGGISAVYSKVLSLFTKTTFSLNITTPGQRNAIWFDATQCYETIMRLQYDANTLDEFQGWLDTFTGKGNIKLNALTAVTKLKGKWATGPGADGSTSVEKCNHDWDFLFVANFELPSLTAKEVTQTLMIDFKQDSITLDLKFDYDADAHGEVVFTAILTLIGDVISNDAVQGLKDIVDAAGKHVEFPLLRQLSLIVDISTGKPSIQEFGIQVELGVNFGRPIVAGIQQNVVMLFTYKWHPKMGFDFVGSLWTPPPTVDGVRFELFPEYEPFLQFTPARVHDESEWAPYLALDKLAPSDSTISISHLPDGLMPELTRAVFELTNKSVSIDGRIEFDKATNNPDEPPQLPLGALDLRAQYTWGKDSSFTLSMVLGVEMMPPPSYDLTKNLPVELTGTLDYDSKKGWAVSGRVASPGVRGFHLYNFFDADSQGAAADILSHIEIKYLELDYVYTKAQSGDKSRGSEFTFKGDAIFGPLEMNVFFQYKASLWEFILGVGASKKTTLQDILNAVVGTGEVELPSFIGDIAINPPVAPSGDPTKDPDSPFQVYCTKHDRLSPDTTKDVLYTVSVNIDPVFVTFIQYRNTGWTMAKGSSPKRIIKIGFKNIGSVKIPVVGEMPQPFDQIYYMWVQDNSQSASPDAGTGLTLGDVKSLNSLLGKSDAILYKVPPQKGVGDASVVVQAGSHFIVVEKGKNGDEVVLDYVFGASKPQKAQSNEDSEEADVGGDGDSAPPSPKVPFKKSIGPFSISNIGLKYNKKVLSICLDASVVVGPIGLALQGFSLDLDFSKSGSDILHNLPTPSLGLEGLAVSFEQPPVTLAGALKHSIIDKHDYYAGGVDLGFEMYQFLAGGGYGDMGSYVSAFVFMELAGPLIELEFATISGVTGGFGYNTRLTLPTVAQVPQFPFLAMASVPIVPTGKGPLDTLTGLISTNWFGPKPGDYWVAAGLTVSAFQMLSVSAVVVVEWDPAITLGLFGVAIMDVPNNEVSEKLAHVELGIAASVDFGAGIAKIEGQLAPSSFILHPSCHLTGGFALYYWFNGSSNVPNPYAGDWVFSIGGYHQQYKPPSHYPVPPRLQIAWSLDSTISIVGQAYFAITPKMCMAGGQLTATLKVGSLKAWFTAYADFLVNYHPFFFTADGGVSVGVSYTLDLLFVSLDIKIELGATLYIKGPTVQGHVHVDFWVFGFNIDFGSGSLPGTDPATLDQFYDLVLQSGSPAAAAGNPSAPHLISCLSGLIAPPSVPSDSKSVRPAADPDTKSTEWQVHGGTLSFSIACTFAVTEVTVTENDVTLPSIDPPAQVTSAVYARPMHLTDHLTSAVTVTITTPSAGGAGKNTDNPTWVLAPIVKYVPRALWDLYDPAHDPLSPSADTSQILDSSSPATVALMTGITVTAPLPQTSNDLIKKFNAIKSMLQPAGTGNFPIVEAAVLPPDDGGKLEDLVGAWSGAMGWASWAA